MATEQRLGVCYYPEHWPESRWAEDARGMVEIGLQLVRMGEFAWSRLEPRDGHYDFDWLRRAIDTFARRRPRHRAGNADRDAAEMARRQNAGHAGAGRQGPCRANSGPAAIIASVTRVMRESATASSPLWPRPSANIPASTRGKPTMNMAVTTPWRAIRARRASVPASGAARNTLR